MRRKIYEKLLEWKKRKGKKMVEYAIAGMDNQLFVSTDMLQLPDKTTLERLLIDELESKNCES